MKSNEMGTDKALIELRQFIVLKKNQREREREENCALFYFSFE
jgi:hypothetical protein